MQIKDFEITYTRSNAKRRLYMIGDIHGGTIHCVEDDIKAKLSEIHKDKNALWLGTGDYGEFILPGDKRFDPSQKAIPEWVEKDNIAESQRRWVVNLFKPSKEQCVGLLYGNHEENIRKFHNNNIQKNICDDLGVDNLGFSCFLRLFFRRESSRETHVFTGVITHGRSCAVTKGAKLMALRRFMDDFEGDFYAYAHVHDIIIDSRPYLTASARSFNQGKIYDREAVGAMTGCWFRTYTQGVIASYGEQKVYPPTTLGCVYFEFDLNDLTVEVHKSKAGHLFEKA
jgi:hypothetical protein